MAGTTLKKLMKNRCYVQDGKVVKQKQIKTLLKIWKNKERGDKMGKRYKRGNHGRKKPIIVNDFFAREQLLNKHINHFINSYFNLQRPPISSEYEDMNKERLEIKRLLDLQSPELYSQSERRKRFYNSQLTRFKYYYTKWKKLTYYIYLEQRFDMPKHLCPALEFFINISNDINSTIYRL